MPVFPLVGSRITVSGPICPSLSAASIMERPIRSFTLAPGFRLSILATTDPGRPADRRESRTRGVLPIS